MTDLIARLREDRRLRCEPAECWSECEDRMCPYVHRATWWIGDEGPFMTEPEAVAYLAARENDNG